MKILNLFKKPARLTVAQQPAFIEAQSYGGGTYHILPNVDGDGFTITKNTLCGYSRWIATNTMHEATVEQFSASTEGRFWNYCPTCRDRLAQVEAGQVALADLPIKADHI